MVEIDGSIGEGGGQILRSALALSLVTGRPCRLRRIRAGRSKPGLRPQHLASVEAAAAVGAAAVQGDRPGSMELSFAPGTVRAGSYRFSVGTAGSTTLVLQTVLPALLTAGRSDLTLEGGTHNPFAPPFDFLDRVFLPLLRRMGADVRATLERPGFHPAGGGVVRVEIAPGSGLRRLDLVERGAMVARSALARVSRLPRHIAERELAVVGERLGWEAGSLHVDEVRDAFGPGNVLTLELVSERITELFTAFGRRGTPAERVAGEAVDMVEAYLASDVPVGPWLADQLLLPTALAGGGRFRTVRPTPHTRTNAEIVSRFLDVAIEMREEAAGSWLVALDRA